MRIKRWENLDGFLLVSRHVPAGAQLLLSVDFVQVFEWGFGIGLGFRVDLRIKSWENLDGGSTHQTLSFPHQEIGFIKVPVVVPNAVQGQRRPKKPADMAFMNPINLDAYMVQRCLELLQARLHPTAYKRGGGGALNFSWTDRNEEPCYTGHIHAGGRDLLCIVDADKNAVFAKCSSERFEPSTGVCCKEQPAHYLGPLYVDVETWKARAIEINMRFLERDPLAAGPMDLQLIRAGLMGMTDKILLNRLINR